MLGVLDFSLVLRSEINKLAFLNWHFNFLHAFFLSFCQVIKEPSHNKTEPFADILNQCIGRKFWKECECTLFTSKKKLVFFQVPKYTGKQKGNKKKLDRWSTTQRNLTLKHWNKSVYRTGKLYNRIGKLYNKSYTIELRKQQIVEKMHYSCYKIVPRNSLEPLWLKTWKLKALLNFFTPNWRSYSKTLDGR